MGFLRVPMAIADETGSKFETFEALVDTGASFTWVPKSILEKLGQEPQEQWEFELADGRRMPYGVKWINVRLNGTVHPTPVVFGDEGTEPLVGVVTLDESRLGVDSVNQRLIPTPGNLGGPRRVS